jgi:hypothetical protein
MSGTAHNFAERQRAGYPGDQWRACFHHVQFTPRRQAAGRPPAPGVRRTIGGNMRKLVYAQVVSGLTQRAVGFYERTIFWQ